jgi:drug/metabolite transporter (DMT)-like permease
MSQSGEPPTARSHRGVSTALAAAAISGVSVFVNSHGVGLFRDATVYTTAKNTVAAGFLLVATAVLLGRRGAAPTRPRGGRQWAALAVIGVVGGSLPFVLFFEGLSRAASGPVQAQLVHKTLVVWVALLAVPLLHERLGGVQVAAIAVLVTGQVWVAGGPAAVSGTRLGLGELLIALATLLWAVEVVIAKWLLRELDPATVALSRMVLGAVLLLGWLLLRGTGTALLAFDIRQWTWVLLTGGLLAGYVWVWLSALHRAPAVLVTSVLVAAVPMTALLDAVSTGRLPVGQLAGQLIIVTGCVLLLTARRPVGARPQPVGG